MKTQFNLKTQALGWFWRTRLSWIEYPEGRLQAARKAHGSWRYGLTRRHAERRAANDSYR
jgi:hypothetical protein